MSDHDRTPNSPEPATAPAIPPGKARSRLRRFFLRHLPLTVAGAVAVFALLTVGFYFVASSAGFENLIRERLIAEISSLTGGRVQIGAFHWHLLHLEAEADGIVIHGLEDPGEAPYAQIKSLRADVSVLGFITPHILLRNLQVIQPRFHFIVYPDGSTNQPHPIRPRKPNRPAIETLFKLQANHIAVEQGFIDYDNRAAAFDYRNLYAPVNFEAEDVSMVMHYVPAVRGAPEIYRIDLAASDLNLSRSIPRKKPLRVHGNLQATIDLERKGLSLRSLKVIAQTPGTIDHVLRVTGELEDFSDPRWQVKALGDLDLRLLEPATGYPDAPQGIAHVNLVAEGRRETFNIDGSVHVDNASYIGTGILATGVNLDAMIHADARHLLITQVVARLRQGGSIEGTVDLQPWLPAATAARRPPSVEAEGASSARNVLVKAPIASIPVTGKVTANFKDVSLDTVLDMVTTPEYRRLGLDARLNGPSQATWSNGETRSIAVTAAFSLSPSAHTPSGEAPASGAIDATYTQRNGAVDLRKLELHLPASELEAQGTIGAYPVKSPSTINLDFHTHNLGEFDSVLRSLGFRRNGKTGTAALPIALTGQADFHGSWTGSLTKPHLSGALKATQLSIEMPGGASSSGQPRLVRLDSVAATGSYSPNRIVIEHAQVLQDEARIAVNGSLDSSPDGSAGTEPAFDSESLLHARVQAADVDVADVQPFLVSNSLKSLPVAGRFNARFQVDGPLHDPAGSGTVEMASGSLYGEPFEHLRIQGGIANRELNVDSSALMAASGNIAASGSYDFKARVFKIDAHGTGVDISQIQWLRQHNLDVAGKLRISVAGSGTLNDPHVQADAAVNALVLGGQQFGAFEASAHSANHSVAYKVTTQLVGTDLAMQGSTSLNGAYETQAQLDFSRFNIGALFKMSHLDAFSGESALAGNITIEGPLAHPDQLRGDARLRQLAMTVAGIQLQSEGGAHATLAEGRIHLDPVHVTGEDTDLRAQGTVSLQGQQQLDIAASGSVNFKLAETLDSDLTAAGVTTFKVEAHGPLKHPGLQGSIEFQNGALSLEGLPNGLSQLRGTLEFNQNRLEVKTLTAMSGGGLLSVAGFLAYQRGIYADLTVTGKEVHIRYPQGVTSLADAKLQLQGSQNSLELSGNVLINRFATSPDLDLAALAAQANSALQSVPSPQAASNHVRLDVHIVSSPQLSFQNAFAKLAGDVDLRVRGTLASPSLLGRVSITEGSAMIAGTRYELERGDITFNNPVRIEPTIDLSATAHVEDYDISLSLNGTLQKLVVSYRSDPPLPESDVVSLLALGHTANQQRLYTQQQEQSITNPTTDALLGGALNATVSSRIQKLFGAGSVKIDPNYLGAFGNSTSRITVQEQLGRDVTLTYATDVNTTSQQLLQAEIAINRHVSLVVARDESGVFSMVIKATRRYR